MNSLILRTVTRLLLSWMLLFSLWVLFRGHNAPGGGFIGGLLAASALSLYLLAYGLPSLQAIIRFSPLSWLSFGFLLILISGIWGILSGQVFLSAVWLKGFFSWFNSPLLFDTGVYIIVCFSILAMIMALERSK